MKAFFSMLFLGRLLLVTVFLTSTPTGFAFVSTNLAATQTTIVSSNIFDSGLPIPVPGPDSNLKFPWDNGLLRVSKNGRYLENHDGSTNTPFFWLGDTAWLMPHRLTIAEAERYFTDRRNKGFTVIQIMVTGSGSVDGLINPAHSQGVSGELPFIGKDGSNPRFNNGSGRLNRFLRLFVSKDNLPDPTKPNKAFFQHMDRIIDGAEKHGLYVVLSPTWGRYVCPRRYERSYTPEIFDTKSADTYGKFLGRRYKDRPNIIWLMGGDRDYCASGVAIWDALANGIKSSGDSHLISYHPSSGHEGYTSSGFWLYENNNHQYPSWLDFNMSQPSSDNILKINRLDYRISPVKPTVVGESNYFMQQEPSDPAGSYALGVIRAQPYWSILTGAAGYTYGNNHIWWFDKDDGAFPDRRPFFRNKDGKIWSDDEYLNSAGTRWAVIWKDYFSTIDWWNLVPDQSAILTSENSSGEYEYKVAARTKTGDRVLVYFPNASSASIDLAKITSGGEYIDARWLKTTDGSIKHDSIIPSTSSSRIYTLPFGWEDGLLILEGADRKPDNQEIIKL